MFTYEEITTLNRIFTGKTAMDWLIFKTEMDQQFEANARAVEFTERNAEEAARMMAMRMGMYEGAAAPQQTKLSL